MIHLSRPDITEKEIKAVTDVLKSPNLSLGPKLTEFESAFASYVGTKKAVAVNSGTSALFLAALALDIAAGDEVITTPFTFIASATSIMMTGAKPVFVDIDENSLNIAPELIETAITERTKAILPVEVFGNPCGIDQVCEIAKTHNLPVIEDSCEAVGSTLDHKKCGTFGKIGTFAFYPNKQITTGEGGIILTDSADIADLCSSLRNQGRAKKSSWLGHQRLGYNFRLSDINCALGIAQLQRIEEIIQKRKQVAKWYQQALASEKRIILPAEPANCSISWFVFVIRLTEDFSRSHRDKILHLMNEHNIQVSNYFPPVHLQPFMAEKFGFKNGDFPVTEKVAQRTIALPFHNNLTPEQVNIVSGARKKSLDKI